MQNQTYQQISDPPASGKLVRGLIRTSVCGVVRQAKTGENPNCRRISKSPAMYRLMLGFVFALFFPVWSAYSMSNQPRVFQTPTKKPVVRPADDSTTTLIKSAVQEICIGKFGGAKKILSEAGTDNPKIDVLSDIISQYKEIEVTREQERQKALDEQLAELEKLKTLSGANEPNLLEVFPVVVRACEFAVGTQKEQILSDEFVKKVIKQARRSAEEFESKGKWLDSLIYCYSWLEILYEDDKAVSDKKKELEDKSLIKASLMDNPCEAGTDRYRKIKPQMFTRSLDVLEYGYVEPFYYSNMADKAFSRCRYLAEILQFSDSNTSNAPMVDSLEEALSEPVTDGKVTIDFSKDKLPDFVVGLGSLRESYDSELLGLSRDQFIRLFNQILTVNSSTVQLPEQVIISHFAEASLSALDPHTMIIWPKEKEDFEKNITNEFTGIGVEISKADGFLRAVSLLPGTPAYNSGMDVGDVIEAINGEKTRNMSITCAVSKITGPAGTKVVLVIRRADEEKTRTIEITRAKIIVPTTRGWSRDNFGNWLYFVDDREKIGYVRITNFSAATASDLNVILDTLESRDMKALILDLRFNTGGYLQSAADIADMFISKGIIVSTQPRVGLPTWEAAHLKGTHPAYPLVVIINSASASASEIVAGALADKTYSRATLVGEQSYGKGSVQTITGYPGDGAQLKYTMAYYHLPDGSKVKDRHSMEKIGRKDWGIMPDVEISLRSDESRKMLDIQRDNDVLAAANHDDTKAKLTRHSLEEILQADRQLAVAILIARAKLIESGL